MGAKVVGSATGIVQGICTDTRAGVEGSLFFALRGENSDGHAYVANAIERGAVGVVVDHQIAGVPGVQLIAADPLIAMGRLAQWYRSRFNIPVIGITGSVGKTSTKEMIALAIESKFNPVVSEKNYNNEIGVPKTLLTLDESHSAAVIEMAMRGPGQIAWLAEIAGPTIGVITNIGLSHIELLGSRDGIAAAKAELLEALPQDCLAVLPEVDEYCAFLRAAHKGHSVTFGEGKAADFRVTDLSYSAKGDSTFKVNGEPFTIHAPGVHHPINAAAACAVANHLGIPLSETALRLELFRGSDMRMEIIHLPDGTTILSDCYNAAPDSMRSALETLQTMGEGQRRMVAILGEMRELGDRSVDAHKYVGELIARTQPDTLITVGNAALDIARSAKENGWRHSHEAFKDTSGAAVGVTELIRPGDLILVKGSRAMEMENIVSAIRAGAGVLVEAVSH